MLSTETKTNKTLEETIEELFKQPWNLVQYKVQPVFYDVLRNSKSHGFLYKNAIRDGIIKFQLEIPVQYKGQDGEIKKSVIRIYLFNENNEVRQLIFFNRNDNLIEQAFHYFKTNGSYRCEKLTDTYFVFYDNIKSSVILLDANEYTPSINVRFTQLHPHEIMQIKSREL